VFTGLGIVVYTFGAPPLLMNQASLSCPHAEQPAASGDCYVEASGVNWSPANSKFHVYMFSNISYLLHICSKSMKLIHKLKFVLHSDLFYIWLYTVAHLKSCHLMWIISSRTALKLTLFLFFMTALFGNMDLQVNSEE
jgi:hypothetical protein